MKYDVFISYSRLDTAVADRICAAFDKAGISYFIDRQGIGGGLEFPEVIASAIRESDIFLFLASANSYRSKFTNSEITYAFNKKKKNHLLPYVIDGSSLPDALEFVFSCINIRNIKDHPVETALVQDVMNLLGRESVAPVGPESVAATSSEKKTLSKKFGLIAIAALALVIGGLWLFNLSEADQKTQPSHDIQSETTSSNAGSSLDSMSKTETSTGDFVLKVKGVEYPMVFVEGGTFKMGSDDSEAYSWEKPVHQVTLNSYCIGKYEVTQELWEAVMGSNPSRFKGARRPVEQVSWDDCQVFIRKLNSLTGKNFKLPTEAQWEYAARGGKKSMGYKYSGSNTIGDVAWYDGNSGSKPHDVGTKSPNELGLYDMAGNVWEWCNDRYGSYESSSQTNPSGPSSGSSRVRRGGSWYFSAGFCSISYRSNNSPGNSYFYLGFRLCL